MRKEVSRKRVRVYAAGQLVADSRQPVLVWEIPYYPTYHLPAADVLAKLVPAADDTYDVVVGDVVVPGAARRSEDLVRLDFLRPSDTETSCPYKGNASYWHVGDREDIVWIYRTPVAESQKIAGLACFYNEKVEIYLDGELQERPQSPFS
ncbi:MAG: DUF427 domain-containing protein [Pseudonocardiaceae bacterium]|nr:DUF427 domain-containing protein [Pseudonocardiaceae bacterium]